MDAIIENSKEVRDWLRDNDYSLAIYYIDYGDLIFTTTKFEGATDYHPIEKHLLYGTCRKDDFYRYSAKEHVLGGRVDCRGNFEKFKQMLSE